MGEHRRGHGSLYAALTRGRVDVERLRTSLAALPLPCGADGRLVLAVGITCWLRPDAHTSAERILCHTYGHSKDQQVMIPGWPYSFVTALEPGRSSWTAPLDAQRLAPGDDAATVTAGLLRQLVQRPITAGQWRTVTPTSSSLPTPATTRPAWPTCCATCRCRYWAGCAPIECCAARPRPDSRARTVDHPPRRRVHLRRPRELGHARRDHCDRHPPLRRCRRPLLEPAASPADTRCVTGSARTKQTAANVTTGRPVRRWRSCASCGGRTLS